mmetsp:Transcript_27198/g.54398  ORF Transcript_27198/g.54398 Transcript_27198/m.54398 type:complete len:308 (-) Transcript_27198:173-1096(-)
MSNKVLVTAATGKAGFKSCLALIDEGFEVYGTTRSSSGAEKLTAAGIKPIVGDYVTDISRCLDESGAKKLLFLTDFFLAAKKDAKLEEKQGKDMIDAAVAANIEHAVFISVADAETFPKECDHILAKVEVEEYLKASSLKSWSIAGASTFFENFDDAANYNPLTKGSLKFLMEESCKWCATYDIGKGAAVMFKNPNEWHTKKMDIIGYVGNLDDCADALEKVGSFKVQRGLAMPLLVRRLLLKDLDYMCEFFAGRNGPGLKGNPEDFKKYVPDALDAEGWFRHHNKYANGEEIVGNTTPPASSCTIS